MELESKTHMSDTSTKASIPSDLRSSSWPITASGLTQLEWVKWLLKTQSEVTCVHCLYHPSDQARSSNALSLSALCLLSYIHDLSYLHT